MTPWSRCFPHIGTSTPVLYNGKEENGKCTMCGGVLIVLGTRLLSGSAWLLSTYLKEGEEQKEVREAKGNEEKESEVDGVVGERTHLTCA